MTQVCHKLRLLHLYTHADKRKVWDCKPEDKEQPINWVELKTSEEILDERNNVKFERKLLRIWAQSFLLGVPKIVVGFRSKEGVLRRLEEIDTQSIPGTVKRNGKRTWDGNICINFTASFLACVLHLHLQYTQTDWMFSLIRT